MLDSANCKPHHCWESGALGGQRGSSEYCSSQESPHVLESVTKKSKQLAFYVY